MRRIDNRAVVWRELPGLTPYVPAMADMLAHRERIIAGEGREEIWLVRHPPGYSRGHGQGLQGPEPSEPVELDQDPAARSYAGAWWYHGPGVLGVVVLLDLRERRRSFPGIARAIHAWLVRGLRRAGADVHTLEGRPGVWATVAGEERKVAAITLSLKKWVTAYGVGIVLDDLAPFDRISPCGADPCEVASLRDLGVADDGLVRAALRAEFESAFGPIVAARIVVAAAGSSGGSGGG